MKKIDDYRVQWLARIVESDRFELVIGAVIFVNAIALAWLTLPSSAEQADTLVLVDELCYLVYLIELLIRMASYGRKPWKFFRSGWNIFDFIVVGLSPLAQGQTVVLRLLRLLRLVRIFRFLPEVRILSLSIVRSVPPLMSISVLIGLLLFLYGMAGTYLFGDALPKAWGDIGTSLKTLFVMLTLENFPQTFEEGVSVSPLAFPFFISYMFVIVFTVLNILIGIVLNAMDEARKENADQMRRFLNLEQLAKEVEQSLSDGHVSDSEIETLEARLKKIRQGER
jgi:voltage-gated sodium channel